MSDCLTHSENFEQDFNTRSIYLNIFTKEFKKEILELLAGNEEEYNKLIKDAKSFNKNKKEYNWKKIIYQYHEFIVNSIWELLSICMHVWRNDWKAILEK